MLIVGFLKVRWQHSMIANKAVQKTYLTGDVHAEFMKGHIAGAADYDILLNKSN